MPAVVRERLTKRVVQEVAEAGRRPSRRRPPCYPASGRAPAHRDPAPGVLGPTVLRAKTANVLRHGRRPLFFSDPRQKAMERAEANAGQGDGPRASSRGTAGAARLRPVVQPGGNVGGFAAAGANCTLALQRCGFYSKEFTIHGLWVRGRRNRKESRAFAECHGNVALPAWDLVGPGAIPRDGLAGLQAPGGPPPSSFPSTASTPTASASSPTSGSTCRPRWRPTSSARRRAGPTWSASARCSPSRARRFGSPSTAPAARSSLPPIAEFTSSRARGARVTSSRPLAQTRQW